MANTISHRQVREFYEAHMLRDPERIAQFLHDDVEWSVAGPIDLIPFCGQRRGKEAAIDTMVRIAPALLTVTKLEFDELLVDGERAAGFNHLTAIQNSTGRTISYQRAEFFQYRDGEIISYRDILDSFDVAEQVLGHSIDLSMPEKPTIASGNVIVA